MVCQRFFQGGDPRRGNLIGDKVLSTSFGAGVYLVYCGFLDDLRVNEKILLFCCKKWIALVKTHSNELRHKRDRSTIKPGKKVVGQPRSLAVGLYPFAESHLRPLRFGSGLWRLPDQNTLRAHDCAFKAKARNPPC